MTNSPTVLVTGASAGIGAATASRLLDRGFTVYGAARRLDKMAPLAERGMTALKMDITSDDEVRACVERIREERGGLDALVNNAGYGLFGPVEHVTLDEARRQFEVNLFGLANLTQRVLPLMREKGAGTIVNVSSIGARVYTPFGAWYHATKHALEGWSDCLRLETRDFGINVVVVRPGAIRTEFAGEMLPGMFDRVGDGPYRDVAPGFNKATAYLDSRLVMSPPEGIAKVIVKAIESKRPKTRYVAGRFGRSSLLARSVLSDRMFDAMLLRAFK